MSGARWRPAFIRNQGQQPEAVRYFTDAGGDRLSLTTDAAVWAYALPDGRVWSITLRLPAATSIQLVERAPGVVSLFRGPNASQWRSGAERWSALRFVEPWPGIDLTFRVGEDLSWSFDVAPGADVESLACAWEGATVHLDEEGDLMLSQGELRLYHPRPQATQDGRALPVRYRLVGPNQVGFWLDAFNPMLPVQITIARQGRD